MKIIILAAGQGTRLRPYTNDVPKCMVEIDNKSLIQRQIEVVKSRGIKNIYLVTGYHSEKLKNDCFHQIYNKRYMTTNMVYSLFCAEEFLNDEIIISYGDIVYSSFILDKLLSSRDDISVVVDKKWQGYWSTRFENYLTDIESLEISQDGNIIDIGKKVIDERKVQGQYIGLLKLSKQGTTIFKQIYKECHKLGKIGKKSIEEAYMTDFIQEVIDRGFQVSSVLTKDAWVEIDTISDLKMNLNKKRLAQISKELNN